MNGAQARKPHSDADAGPNPLPRGFFGTKLAVNGHPLRSHDATGQWLAQSHLPNMAGELPESRLAVSGEPSDLAAVALRVRQVGVVFNIESHLNRQGVAGPEQGTVGAVIVRQAFGERGG